MLEVTTHIYSGNNRFFNIQNYYEDTSVVELFKGPLGTALKVITFISFVSYRYVSVVNRHRDEKTMIYPIVAHLYQIVNFISYFYLSSVALINFIVFLWPNLITLLINGIVIIVAQLVHLFLTPIINSQLFFLSIYRFLLYVASDSVSERLQKHREKIVLVSQILAYSFVTLYYATFLLAAHYHTFLDWFPIMESLPMYEIFMVLYISLITIEISCILSCIPYILMILKIIKFKRMMTQTFAIPEHYIIYQVVIISVIVTAQPKS